MSANILKTRQDDEDLLQILKLRMTHQASAVAKWCGLPSSRIRNMCNRILDEDLRASVIDGAETPAQVMASYWRAV